MINLSKIYTQLEGTQKKLEEKIQDIHCKADEQGRELTEKEEERIEIMQEEIFTISDALEKIKFYCWEE